MTDPFHDHVNQLTSMTDALGTTTFNYNASGNLAYEDGPWASDRVTYGYTHGRRTSLALQRPSASDWSMSYTYDSSLRLDAITSPAGTFDYRYVGAERRIDEIGLPGTLKIDYAYTSVDKRLSDTWMKYGAVIKNRHSYGYNVAGWKTSHTLPSGATATLAHDALGQLTDADNYHSTNFDYAYDNGRNLDFRKINGVTEDFSVNALNQLTSSPLGTPTHDTNGNMTYDGAATYTYDHANRLTQVKYQTGADHWRETYTYDGLSRLRKVYTEHSTNGTTWTFSTEVRLIYDGRLAIQERNASNAVVATYTRGADISGSLQGAGGIGGILAREWSSNIAFYHSDAGGNVTQLVNSSGTVMASYQYDPYGMLLSQSGTWADENPYMSSSKRFLGDSLYYYGFRFYHTDLQRWLNRDPLGETGGINLYGFVGNGPISFVDPYGLIRWYDVVGAIPTPPQWIVDSTAGMGDHLSFGITDFARDRLGWNDQVDKCSGGYATGRVAGSLLDVAATGGSLALTKAAAKRSASQLSRDRTNLRNALGLKPSARDASGNVLYAHHNNSLLGHPGRKKAFFPSAGLPNAIKNSRWNGTPLTHSAHMAEHRRIRRIEDLARGLGFGNPGVGAGRVGLSTLRPRDCK